MPFITFIYKVGKNPKIYYGKYCIDYISDDHDGLDNEVKYTLIIDHITRRVIEPKL